MEAKRLRQGEKYDIFAISIDEKIEVVEFIDSLDDANLKQLFSILERTKDHGPPTDESKYRGLGDGIYEIKTHSGSGFRVLCFNATINRKRALILTHGFPKPKKNQLNREKRKAVDIRNKYFKTQPLRIIG